MSLIEGISSSPNPAVIRAYLKGLNARRNILFPGLALKFFEMSPEGKTELLTLASDWGPRKAEERDGLGDGYWVIPILSASLTDAIANKSTTVTIGDTELKGHKFKNGFGKFGVRVLTGEVIL